MRELMPARRTATRRTFYGLRAGAAVFAAAGVVGFTLLTSGVASAVPAPTPRVVAGNVTTCAGAGLAGEIILEGGSGSASSEAGSGTVTGLELDVTINAGFTATGIAVKGGPDTNVYDGPFVGPTTVEDMVAPLNKGGEQSGISHWFVCGFETAPTTPPATPPTTPPATPPTTPPTETPTAAPTAPTTSPPGQLPVTGGQTGLVIGSSLALLASGAMLVALARQRRRFVA
jgi:hypothetical protein